MKLFFVCLLAGLAVATTPSVNHCAWKKNTEYNYRVNGRTLTALHDVVDQYAGVFMRANLKIALRENGKLSGWVEQPEYAEIHINLPEGWDSEISEEKLHYQALPMSKKPFDIEMENCVVKKVYVNKDVSNWEANLIRSLVSQIQVDTQGENSIPSRFNQKPEEGKYSANYKTMEDTVTGKTETLYDVFELPEHVLQNRPQIAPLPHLKADGKLMGIVKTKNYSNAEQIVDFHFGLPEMSSKNVYRSLERFISKSSVSLVVVSGKWNHHTIQSSVTTNKVIVSPTLYGSQTGMVGSRMNITLESVNNADKEPEKLEAPVCIGNLVYSYDSPFAQDSNVRATLTESNLRNKLPRFAQESSEERREHEKRYRHSRSIYNKIIIGGYGNDDSGSDESSENPDDYQPIPTLQEPPSNPFLPYFIGKQGQSIKTSADPVESLLQLVRRVAEGIREPNQMVKQQTLATYKMAIDYSRIMSAKELKEVSQRLWEAQKKQQHESSDELSFDQLSWKVLRDCIAQTGTGPAFLAIKEWIQTKKIQGEEAAQIFATLPHSASHPTEEYVRSLYELCTCSQVKSQPRLSETAILSFTELVRRAFVHHEESRTRYPQQTFRKLASEESKYNFVTKELIPYLEQQLEDAYKNNKHHRVQVYIRALGNVAHARILSVFKPYLEGERKLTQFQRTLMVLSMDELTKTYPKEAQSVLYKLYANTGDDIPVRVAAVFLLMRTIPPASMLQRMAEYTHVEPSMHVRSAIASSIESAAQLKEQYQKLAANAQAAVKLLKPEEHSIVHCYNYLRQYFVENAELNYKQTFQLMNPMDALSTNFLYYSLRINKADLSHQYISMSALLSGLHSLFSMFEIKTNEPPYGNSNPKAEEWVQKLSKALNIDLNQEEAFEAAAFVQWFGTNRFLAFDEKNMANFLKNFKLSDVFESVRLGQKFNYTKMYNGDEITICVPTEMSFPFIFTLNKPTLVNIGGQLQQSNPQEDSLSGEIEIVLNRQVQSKIGFVTLHDSKMYVAGYNQDSQLYLPISAKIGRNKQGTWKMQLGQLFADRKDKILHYSSKPYTAQLDILALQPDMHQQNAHVLHRDDDRFREYDFGHENGVVYRVKVNSEQIAMDYHTVRREMELIYGSAEIIHRDYCLEFAPDLSSSSSLKFSLDYKQFRKTERSLNAGRTPHTVAIANDDKVALYIGGNLNEQTKQPNLPVPDNADEYRELMNQYVELIASSLNYPYVYAINIQIYFPQNPKRTRYNSVLTYGRSAIENQFGHLFYFTKSDKDTKLSVFVTGDTEASEAPAMNFIQALRADSFMKSNWRIIYDNENLDNPSQITIKSVFRKTEQRQLALQQSPLAQQCANQMEQNNNLQHACSNLTADASRMNRADISIQFKNIDDVARNMTEKVYRYIRHAGFEYLTENNVNATGSGSGDKIRMTIAFEPKHLHSVNFTIQTPKSNAQFENIPLNQKEMFAIRPEANPIRDFKSKAAARVEPESIAVLDARSVTTFNNRSYSINLGNCWHVFLSTAQWSPSQNRYIVLVRNANEPAQTRMVRLLYGRPGYYKLIDLKPNQESSYSVNKPCGSVEIDGKQTEITDINRPGYMVADTPNNDWVEIRVLSNGEIKINMNNDLTVYYDGARVKTRLSELYINGVRGLCGSNNNEPFIDYVAPRGCLYRNPEHFVASYAIPDETCEDKIRKAHEDSSAPELCAERRTLFANVVSKKDTHTHNEGGDCRTRHQTRYTLEDGGKVVCFTTRALPVCAKSCGNSKKVDKKIDVHCLKRSSTVNMFIQQIDLGANPDFSEKPVTKQIKIRVPSKCA